MSRLQRRFGVGERRLSNWVMDEKLHLIAMSEQADTPLGGGSRSLSKNTLDASVPVMTDKEDNSQVALLEVDLEQNARLA